MSASGFTEPAVKLSLKFTELLSPSAVWSCAIPQSLASVPINMELLITPSRATTPLSRLKHKHIDRQSHIWLILTRTVTETTRWRLRYLYTSLWRSRRLTQSPARLHEQSCWPGCTWTWPWSEVRSISLLVPLLLFLSDFLSLPLFGRALLMAGASE